jgi:transposase
VSRDRSQTYADAIQQVLPEATQVADRWHLLKNASDALYTPAGIATIAHNSRIVSNSPV